MANQFQVKVKGLDKLKKDLSNIVKNILSRGDIETILIRAREIIYKRTKSGKGVSAEKNGTNVKLPPLSEAYIKYRRQRILGPYARSGLSNITLSGELLESITYRVISNLQGVVFIPNDRRNDSDLTNRELAEILAKDKNRLFLALSTTEEKILDAFVNRLVRDKLRSIRKL